MKKLLFFFLLLSATSFAQEVEYRYNYYTQKSDMILRWQPIEQLVDSAYDSLYVQYGNYFPESGWLYSGDTIYIDTTGAVASGQDSIYHLFTDSFSSNGWYKGGDTVINDTTHWYVQEDYIGDFDSRDFYVGDFYIRIFSGYMITNKSNLPVQHTNKTFLRDSTYFPWRNPLAETGVLIKQDGLMDTVELVEKAWKLWADSGWFDRLWVFNLPYQDQLYSVMYNPATDEFTYYDKPTGSGTGGPTFWNRDSTLSGGEFVYPKTTTDNVVMYDTVKFDLLGSADFSKDSVTLWRAEDSTFYYADPSRFGGGAADNLGNHIATQDLQMSNYNIDGADTIYSNVHIFDWESLTDGQWKGDVIYVVCAGYINKGELVRHGTSGLTKASDASNIPPIGIALEDGDVVLGGANDSLVAVLINGFYCETDWAWTKSNVLYAGSVGGSITATPPTDIQDYVHPIGQAMDADRIRIWNAPVWIRK